MTKKKKRVKTWSTLKHDKCPKCNIELSKGMFIDGYTACQNCGFIIKDTVKAMLVKRDHSDHE